MNPKGQSTKSYWWVYVSSYLKTQNDASLKPIIVLFQRDPFIQMYEERSVDVAGYVCRILDQMPASPSSPMYMDWEQNKD